jgi:membrane protein
MIDRLHQDAAEVKDERNASCSAVDGDTPMNTVKRLREWLQQWWRRRDEATRALPRYLYQVIINYSRYGTLRSAALSYYTIFSIFPLSLLLVVAVGSVLDVAVAQQQVATALDFFLPSTETTQLLLDNIGQTIEQNRQLSLVAVLGLVWSGLGLFSNLTTSLDLIFRVPNSRSLWRQRFIAILMTLTLIVLVTTSFVASGALWLADLVFFSSDGGSLWLTAARLLLPLSLNMVIFVLLFRFVPARRVYWDAVWAAAIFGAIGWELAKGGFGLYLESFANYTLVYGSIATVIVLLFWSFVMASVLVFSAELCAQLNEWVAFQRAERVEQQPKSGEN